MNDVKLNLSCNIPSNRVQIKLLVSYTPKHLTVSNN